MRNQEEPTPLNPGHIKSQGDSPLGHRIRAQMREFFFVEDEPWRRDVADQGLEAIHRTLDEIGGDAHR